MNMDIVMFDRFVLGFNFEINLIEFIQIFDGFCEIEEDPLSDNHKRYRRAIDQGIDPAEILLTHEHVKI